MKKTVTISMPTVRGPQSETAYSIEEGRLYLSQQGWSTWRLRDQTAVITTARNNAVHEFLKKPQLYGDILIFIDDDVIFDPKVLEAVVEGVRGGLHLVGVTYPVKKISWPKVAERLAKGLDPRFSSRLHLPLPRNAPISIEKNERGDLFAEVFHLPTGFLAMSREMLFKMLESYPETAYVDEGSGECVHNIFSFEVAHGRHWGEDFNFCRKWRQIGGKVHLLLDAIVGHVGPQIFFGDLNESLPDIDKLFQQEAAQ